MTPTYEWVQLWLTKTATDFKTNTIHFKKLPNSQKKVWEQTNWFFVGAFDAEDVDEHQLKNEKMEVEQRRRIF